MKKIFLLTIMCLITFQSNSQDFLKEISKTFDNGQPMFIDYLETENLKKVKTELYNEKGTLVFSIKFNKESGLPNGEFYDLINKGYFDNGELNCKNCMLVEANSPSVYTYNNERMNTEIIIGDVVKGSLVGEVKTYDHYEETYNKVDWNSTRSYVAAGAGIGFRDVKTYTTGKFIKTLIDTKVYNINGVLDGTVNISYTAGRYPNEVKLKARLSVKNGIIKSLVSYDEKGLQRDSISIDQKIWKMNYKYHKNNNDFPIFDNLEDISDNNHGLDRLNNPYFYNPFYPESMNNSNSQSWRGGTTEQVIFTLGGNQRFIRYNNYSKYSSYDTGGPKQGLDNNGLYTIRLTGMFDNIIKYDLGEINYYTGYEDYKTHYFCAYANEKNLLHIIYNTLSNYSSLNKEWVTSMWETKYNLEPFYKALTALTIYNENGRFDYSTAERKNLKDFEINKNSFSKYVKSNDVILKRKESLKYFFNNILSITDYLKACKESMGKNETEIQEIWVLNLLSNKYDKVDFDALIKLAEIREKELQEKEDQKTKLIEAEQEEFPKKHSLSMKFLLEDSEDLDDFKNKFTKQFKDEIKEFRDIENWLNKLYSDYLKTLIIPLESDNKNIEFENKKTKEYLELEFLKELKLVLTSEKSSEKYSSYISEIVKQYNKSYNLKIQDLEVYISQKNKNKEYYRYIFSNIEDLESLKKAFNQYAQPTYIDLDNKAPSIYYKK